MTTPDHTKWLVALCAKVFERDQISRSEIFQWKDPSTGDARSYVLVSRGNQKCLVEFQKLSQDFSSYFVGRHVVEDGSLYVMNVVDPLFFVLATAPVETNKTNARWQPLDQTLDHLMENAVIRECIFPEQLGNLCQVMCTEQTDNVAYFKFSPDKAIQWLQKKQTRVYDCLLQQQQQRSKRRQALLAKRPKSCASNTGGSVSSTFYVPEEEAAPKALTTATSNDTISPKMLKQLKMESIQIVCNYLSEEWTTKFLASLEVTEDEVFETTPVKNTTTNSHQATPAISSTTTPAKVTPKPMAKKQPLTETPRSVANKQLEKVNKRGMSALTSFFGPVKKKKQEAK